MKEEYFKAISENNAEKVREILSTGFDVNTINPQGATGLMMAAMRGNLVVVIELLNHHGIDIQYTRKGFGNALNAALMSPSESAEKQRNRVDIIRHLLQKGIDENQKMGADTPLDKARKGSFHEALPLLERNIWKGLPRDKLAGLDSIFHEKNPFEMADEQISMCPVCTIITIRTKDDYCKFVGHNCADLTPHFNKDLYKKYNKLGQIRWCVACNRIVSDHTHYEISRHDNKTEINRLDEPTCGQVPEKLIRINACRNKIHELQSLINRITADEAIKQITEAAWDAPLTNETLITEWDVPISEFIESTDNVEQIFVSVGKKYEGKLPITIPQESVPDSVNIVTMNAVPIYVLFQHRDDHPIIGFKTLFNHLISMIEERKIYCFCEKDVDIHPDELQSIHDSNSADVFEFPDSGFNKKFFQELIKKYKTFYFAHKNALKGEDGALVGGGAAQPAGGAGSTRKQKGFGYRKSRKTRKNLKRPQHRRCRKNC